MSIMTVFVLVAAFATVLSLFNGIVSMAHGGESDERQSYALMLKRVGWQGLTVLFILLGMLSQLK